MIQIYIKAQLINVKTELNWIYQAWLTWVGKFESFLIEQHIVDTNAKKLS
jgi:hypothetical protein